MADGEVNLSPLKWLGFVITIIALTGISVILDIPVLRQILGFVFLTFIPGFLILLVLKLNKLGLVEKIVLSMGLSVAFSMLFGLALNGLLLAVGYTRPLSTISLLISFSAVTIVLAIIAYIRNRGSAFTFSSLRLTMREKAFLAVPAIFPLLSIVGMRIMNLTDNNVLLMVLLFLIPAYVIILSFFHRRVSEKVYPAAIFLISISLLLMFSLRSNHIIGSDTHLEYLIFLTTLDNLKWSQLGFGTLDSSLSISLLPAIYQSFLNIAPEYLYKILYSLLVAFLPLVVFLLSRKYIGSFYAFLASVFLMSQIIFLWTPLAARTNTAILFFGLAVLVLFHDDISELGRRILFIVFTAAIIVSHYGVTYVTLFTLLSTWIGMQILLNIASRKKEPAILPAGNRATKNNPTTLSSAGTSSPASNTMLAKARVLDPSQTRLREGITITFIALFLTMLFFWYSQVVSSTFYSGVLFVYKIFTRWEWFLGRDVGSQAVQAAFGRTFAYTGVPQRIEVVFSWLTVILLSVGLLTAIRRFKTMVSTPFTKPDKPDFLLKRFEVEYLALSVVCFLILVATVVAPFIAEYYGIARTYFQMMVPLSIFFIIGGIEIAKYLKSQPYWIILVVLVPYFLSTTGAVTQVFGFPRAITLNSEGELYSRMYVSDGDSYAAKWLRANGEKGIAMFANDFASSVLSSQSEIRETEFASRVLSSPGEIRESQIYHALIPDYEEGKAIGGYIYLRQQDLVDGGLPAAYPGMFVGKNKVYSNGGSEIYR